MGRNEYKTPIDSDSDLTEFEKRVVSELRGEPRQSITTTSEGWENRARQSRGRARREGGKSRGKMNCRR